MAQSAADIARDYPLPVYHYLVRIGGLPFSFSEVQGLNQKYDTAVYRHGLSFKGDYNIVRGLPQPVNVTLKRGIFRFDAEQRRRFRLDRNVVTRSGSADSFTAGRFIRDTANTVSEGPIAAVGGGITSVGGGGGPVAEQFAMSEWLNDPQKRDVLVHLIDFSGQAVVSWTIIDALPIHMDAPTLSAEQNSIAVEGLEVMGTGLRMEYNRDILDFTEL